jgi:hypothetical protein
MGLRSVAAVYGILSSWILNWPAKFNSRVRVKVPKHTPRLLPNNKILKHAIRVAPVLGTHNYITTVRVSGSRPHVRPIASLRGFTYMANCADSDMQQAYSGLQYTIFEAALIWLQPGRPSLLRLATGWMAQGSNPRKGTRFSLFQNCRRLVLGPSLLPIQWVTWLLPVCAFKHSPPSSGEVKNKCSYVPIPCICLPVVDKDFTFLFSYSYYDRLQQ